MSASSHSTDYPPVGSPVLVLSRSPDDGSLLVYRGHVTRIAINPDRDPAAFWCLLEGRPGGGESFIVMKNEGTEWARGDDAETEGALLATGALLNVEQGPWPSW